MSDKPKLTIHYDENGKEEGRSISVNFSQKDKNAILNKLANDAQKAFNEFWELRNTEEAQFEDVTDQKKQLPEPK